MKKKVLIVDDKSEFFPAINETLKDYFDIIFVNSIHAAKKIIKNIELAAVISDFNLAKGSGIDLLVYLFEEHPYIYRALMSGTDKKVIDQLTDKTEIVQHFLAKPLNILKIIELKDIILNQPAYTG